MRVLIALAIAGVALSIPLDNSELKDVFETFKTDFKKLYAHESEEAIRFKIFADNVNMIRKFNQEQAETEGYTMGINQFADFTAAEYRELLGYNASAKKPNPIAVLDTTNLADTVDWTTKGAVTPVKNQAQCGSCWAFSSTGALEGAWQIATGKLVSFSEQQLVDCAKFRWGNMGCSGGLQPHAFDYVEKNALCTEEGYPYTGKNSLFTPCKATSCGTPGLALGALTGYKMVDGSEAALMEAIAQQPVSVSIEADQDVFHLYKSGIVKGPGCGTSLDHAVLAVGYGTDNGVKYWKVKNSWTTSWGEAGYVRIIRGTDECGILNGPPVYPVVKASMAEIQV